MDINKILEEYGLYWLKGFGIHTEKIIDEYTAHPSVKNYGSFLATKRQLMEEVFGNRSKIVVANEERHKDLFYLTDKELLLRQLEHQTMCFTLGTVSEASNGHIPIKFKKNTGMMPRAKLRFDMGENPKFYEELCPEHRIRRMFDEKEAVTQTAVQIEQLVDDLVEKLNGTEQIKQISLLLNKEFDKVLDPLGNFSGRLLKKQDL